MIHEVQLVECCEGSSVKEVKMDWICYLDEEKKVCIQHFWWKNLLESDQLKGREEIGG
jgi:hypothetical protein